MPRGCESAFIRKSSHPSSFSSMSRNFCSNRIYTLWIGSAVFLLIVSAVGILALELNHPPKQFKTTKTKRFVDTMNPNSYYKTPSMGRDIEIIPEICANRRTNQHENHRYIAMEPDDNFYKKILKDLYEESGWSPKPFEMKTNNLPNSIQQVITKDELEDQQPPEEMLPGRKGPKGPLEPSMRLMGVYVQDEADEDSSEDNRNENHHYPREINLLMHNDYDGDIKEGNWSLKKVFKGRGSPFQLPPKGSPGFGRYHTSPRNYRQKRKKPITILLGIYPMTHIDGHPRGGRPKYNKHEISPAFSESANVLKFLHPHQDGKGMIMKLNLYPRKRLWRRPNIDRHDRRYNKIPDRRDQRYNKIPDRRVLGGGLMNKGRSGGKFGLEKNKRKPQMRV